MRLIDRIIQCRTPFIVQNCLNHSHTRLSGAMDAASDLERCPIRYVLDDALISLCTDLAYSNGTTVMDCADLIRVPAENIWVEWCNKPWQHALSRNGLIDDPDGDSPPGHYGMLIRASSSGRRGAMRAFWSVGDRDLDVHASATQARFYLDDAAAPALLDESGVVRVAARAMDPEGLLSRCFHFEFEDSWAQYYRQQAPLASQQKAILHQSIGVVALGGTGAAGVFSAAHDPRGTASAAEPASAAESAPHATRPRAARRAYRGKCAAPAPMPRGRSRSGHGRQSPPSAPASCPWTPDAVQRSIDLASPASARQISCGRAEVALSGVARRRGQCSAQ